MQGLPTNSRLVSDGFISHKVHKVFEASRKGLLFLIGRSSSSFGLRKLATSSTLLHSNISFFSFNGVEAPRTKVFLQKSASMKLDAED
jgi:hypothetical protein